jgi:proteasome alpha subunit
MTAPFYVGPEQIVRDKSEYARRGIARGRSVVALTYSDGILFVAENPSKSLHKIGEIYDRIGFAAVGRYPEFENLRVAGVRYADMRGYSYDRRDVSGRGLANSFAQLLGSIFIESSKPYEVEVVVAEVGDTPESDNMYRLTFDGSLAEERGFLAMGGQAEAITVSLREGHVPGLALTDAMRIALTALQAGMTATPSGTAAAAAPAAGTLTAANLEVGVLDRNRPRRAFSRITGDALTALVEQAGGGSDPGEQSESANPE